MQIIVRRGELDQPSVVTHVVACYDEHAEINLAAYGEGLTVLSLPMEAVDTAGGRPTLKDGWRDRFKGAAASATMHPVSQREQIARAIEMIGLILDHGSDASKWPDNARSRRTEFDRARNASRG